MEIKDMLLKLTKINWDKEKEYRDKGIDNIDTYLEKPLKDLAIFYKGKKEMCIDILCNHYNMTIQEIYNSIQK